MIWIICFSTALLHSSRARSHILPGEEEWKGHKREVLLTKQRPGWCQVVSSCTVELLKKQVWKVDTLHCKVVGVYPDVIGLKIHGSWLCEMSLSDTPPPPNSQKQNRLDFVSLFIHCFCTPKSQTLI